MTYKEDERFTVSHSEEITCFALTYDSLHIITGSKDMSLKVWQINGGKLAQVCKIRRLHCSDEKFDNLFCLFFF